MAKQQTRRVYSVSCEGQAWVEAIKATTGLPCCRIVEAAVADLGKRMGVVVTDEDVSAVRARNRARVGTKPELSKRQKADRMLAELRSKGFLL